MSNDFKSKTAKSAGASKSKSKSLSTAKANQKSSRSSRKAWELGIIMTGLGAKTRLLKHQRAILPGLLRSKLDHSEAVLVAQAKRLAGVNIATAEALRSATKFKGLEAAEKEMVGHLIVGLVKAVADQFPDMVTPEARAAAEAHLGETLESSFRREIEDFFAVADGSKLTGIFEVGDDLRELRGLGSVREIRRQGLDMQRRVHPACAGDLEYFAKGLNYDPNDLDAVRAAVQVLERFSGQAREPGSLASNVLSFSAIAGGMNFGSLANALDVVGCLEVLINRPEIGSYENLMQSLSEKEQICVMDGLTAQHEMLEFEIRAICSHPDLDALSEIAGGLLELAEFDPVSMLSAMHDREILFKSLTADLIRNKSVEAVRTLIADYEQALGADTEDDMDDDFYGESFYDDDDDEMIDPSMEDSRDWH